jgi:hypothetical protein
MAFYIECCYAECLKLLTIVLNVIVLSVVMLNVVAPACLTFSSPNNNVYEVVT